MTNIKKIIDRVRRLLATAQSDNPNEAALAASRAAALVAEYRLTEAVLRVEDTSRAAEPIVEGVALPAELLSAKRVAYREAITDAVADSLGLKVWLRHNRETGGQDNVAFGREGATQAWQYTTLYLCREVDRLCEAEWAGDEGAEAREHGQSARKWKNSFRYGAACTIARRLREQHRVAVAHREQQRAEVGVPAEHANLTSTEQVALAIIAGDEREVETAYADFGKRMNFRMSSGIGTVSARSGYHAGKESAKRIALGGGRGALAAGQGVLR